MADMAGELAAGNLQFIAITSCCKYALHYLFQMLYKPQPVIEYSIAAFCSLSKKGNNNDP